MGASVDAFDALCVVADVAVEERGSILSRNSRIDSRVSALGRVTVLSECVLIDGSVVSSASASSAVVVCVIVGQSKEGVEVCAPAVVVVVFALASLLLEEERTPDEERRGWGCSCCCCPSALCCSWSPSSLGPRFCSCS